VTRREAAKVMDEMEAAGYNTQLRRTHDGDAVHDASYVVDATDSSTGDSTTIHTVEQWEERKQAIAFSREYDS